MKTNDSTEILKAIIELAKEAGPLLDEAEPAIRDALPNIHRAMNAAGDLLSALGPIFARYQDHCDSRRVKRIKNLITQGLSTENAVLLVLDSRAGVQEALARVDMKKRSE